MGNKSVDRDVMPEAVNVMTYVNMSIRKSKESSELVRNRPFVLKTGQG
jgi:hypothetical protein